MEAMLKRVQAAKRQRDERKEREERAAADRGEGAAFGRGQTLLQERQRLERDEASEQKRREKEEQERLAEQAEQQAMQAAIELVDASEQIRIESAQKSAANRLLTGTMLHRLVSFELLKSLVALAAKWPKSQTSEVLPETGTRIQLVVRRIDLDMTAAAVYKSFIGQLGPEGVAEVRLRNGVVDMPAPRPKKDGSHLTEGKSAVIFAEVTPRLEHFLRTGQGWEMGLPDLADPSQLEPATAHVRREREQWVRLSRVDQTDLFFGMCRILRIPFRDAVWQACRCLTACYAMSGHTVRFTTIEFSQTGRREGNRAAPSVDFYDPEAQRFAVCATLEERRLVDTVTVAKAVWFDEPTEEGRRCSMFVVPAHFDSQQLTGNRGDPIDCAVRDARDELHRQSPPGLREEDEEDYLLLVTAKLAPGKLIQYLNEHHDGTRLALAVAHNFQQALQHQGVDPVGVGVSVLSEQIRLDVGTILALAGQQAGAALMKRAKEGTISVLTGIDAKLLQFKVLSAPRPAKSEEGWQIVGKTTKIQRERIRGLVRSSGLSMSQLRDTAQRIRAAVVTAPLTIPGCDEAGAPIEPGDQTTPIEHWAVQRPEDVNDIRVRLVPLPRGRATPLLIQIMEESGEIRVEFDPTARQYVLTLPPDSTMRDAHDATPSSGDSEDEAERHTAPDGAEEHGGHQPMEGDE